MKYLIVSDIHGSLPRLKQVLHYYHQEHYDMLIVLGDILNYGPRNGVPEGLDAQGIANELNTLSDHIVAVRGNCDSEVDQMLLKFPMMADYALLVIDKKRIFLTHGHRYNSEQLPELHIDVMCYGHTHRWMLERQGNCVVCNTGSITFPKEERQPTFATIDEDNSLRIRNLEGSVLKEIQLD
ncbi:MAG: phosphodiesterase [Paludibacteraceae bacterium]|nr:phosphodiesterase [Paludibacteraceae bacterium]